MTPSKEVARLQRERKFPVADEMLECETGSLLGRVADLERQSLAQKDEIVCLRATLADALRRIAQLEGKEKREDERNERRNERMVSSPLRNGHVPLRSKSRKLDIDYGSPLTARCSNSRVICFQTYVCLQRIEEHIV